MASRNARDAGARLDAQSSAPPSNMRPRAWIARAASVVGRLRFLAFVGAVELGWVALNAGSNSPFDARPFRTLHSANLGLAVLLLGLALANGRRLHREIERSNARPPWNMK